MKEYLTRSVIVHVNDFRGGTHPTPEDAINIASEDGWLLRETIITKMREDELLFTFVMEREAKRD